jgi:hypothetical protein
VTRKKIHIDELFSNKLKSLSLFVSSKDLEAIDGKKLQYKDSETPDSNSAFSNFEIEVTEMDWLNTKSKLDVERASLGNKDAFQEKFEGFEIEPTAEDWPITYKKYLAAKSRKLLWWLGTGILALLIGLSLLFAAGSESEVHHGRVAKEKIDTKVKTMPKLYNADESDLSVSQSQNETAGSEDAPVNENQRTQTETGQFTVQTTVAQKSSSIKNKISSKLQIKKENVLKAIGVQSFLSNIDPKVRGNILNAKMENKAELNNGPSNETAEKVRDKEFPEDIQVPKPKSEIISADTGQKKIYIDDEKKPCQSVLGLYVAMVNQINYGSRTLSKGNNDFYNSVRKSADKPSASWSKGFEVGILNYKTQFSIGVQASRQTFVSTYKYNYKVYDSLPVYNPGRTQIIGYFLLRGRDTFINEENKVKLNKIQVPLSFSRIVSFGTKTSLVFGTSMVLDYSSKAIGTKMLNPQNNQLYYYKTLQSFERRFNVLPSLNFGINHQLGKNIMLQSSLYGNAAVFGRFKNNFGANEQAVNLGINLKLLYLIK